MAEELERMRAILAQAAAEAAAQIKAVHLTVYGETDENMLRKLFAQASLATPAQGASLVIERAGSRYICWNCCGLRFTGDDSMCPNCGEEALEIPLEISFALAHVETVP